MVQGLAVLAMGALVGWLGRTPWRTPLYVDQGSAALAGISLFPAIAYAVDMGDNGPGEITNSMGHYPVQGALGLAVFAATLLLAVSDGQPGRLLVRIVAAVPALWIGVESVVWPERNGSVGTLWGVLVTTWGLLLLAALLAPRVLRR